MLSTYRALSCLKVAFFQKVRFIFQISQSPKKVIPKDYPELEIWVTCLLIWVGISNFKLRIVFWNNVFGRNESHFSKKNSPLVTRVVISLVFALTTIVVQVRRKVIKSGGLGWNYNIIICPPDWTHLGGGRMITPLPLVFQRPSVCC